MLAGFSFLAIIEVEDENDTDNEITRENMDRKKIRQ